MSQFDTILAEIESSVDALDDAIERGTDAAAELRANGTGAHLSKELCEKLEALSQRTRHLAAHSFPVR